MRLRHGRHSSFYQSFMFGEFGALTPVVLDAFSPKAV